MADDLDQRNGAMSRWLEDLLVANMRAAEEKFGPLRRIECSRDQHSDCPGYMIEGRGDAPCCSCSCHGPLDWGCPGCGEDLYEARKPDWMAMCTEPSASCANCGRAWCTDGAEWAPPWDN